MKNYYEILQVNEKASKEIISKVYKVLAKKYHPDANPDNQAECAEKFKEISEAYEVLSDEQKRAEYDEDLKAEKESENQESVSLEEYLYLQNYCKELEEKLNNSQSYSGQQNSYNQASSQNNQYQTSRAYTEAEMRAREQAYEDAVNKAYHDEYVNNLRRMGYRVRYKKTFKEKFKQYLALGITIFVLFIIFKIIWSIPSAKEWFLNLFKI